MSVPRWARPALAGSLAALAGCGSIEGTRGLPPWYERYDDEVVLRPLGAWRRSGEERELTVLWPFFRDRRSPQRTTTWLLPIFSYSRHVKLDDPGAGWDRDWMIFPFIFAGSDPAEGAYFALFPLAGRMKGILGQDRIEFAFFPLYFRMQDRTRDSVFFLWPLVNVLRGGGRRGWHVLPFYGRYRARTPEGVPKYDRLTILWPLFTYQRNNLDTLNPVTTWFLFPFYGRMVSEHFTKTTLLWPFMSFVEDRRRNVRRARGILLPFIFARGPRIAQADFWPLFGLKREEERAGIVGIAATAGRRSTYRQYALWPIQRYERFEGPRYREHRFWFLPIFWYADRIRRETDDTEELHWKLWPLFGYEREGGRLRWHALSLLWFREPRFERYWSRLWRIVRYERDGEQSGWEVLWGTVLRRTGPERSVFSILGGLYARERTPERVTYRVFWIPWSVARRPEGG